MLAEQGVREVTLLGQNVNSYADFSGSGSGGSSGSETAAAGDPFAGVYARGFRRCGLAGQAGGAGACWTAAAACPLSPSTFLPLPTPSAHLTSALPLLPSRPGSVYKPRRAGAASFAELLDAVAAVDPEVRVRFTSPHPKDFADDVLQARRQGLWAAAGAAAGPAGGTGRRAACLACRWRGRQPEAALHAACPLLLTSPCTCPRPPLRAGHRGPPQRVQAAAHAGAERQQRGAGAHAAGLHTRGI